MIQTPEFIYLCRGRGEKANWSKHSTEDILQAGGEREEIIYFLKPWGISRNMQFARDQAKKDTIKFLFKVWNTVASFGVFSKRLSKNLSGKINTPDLQRYRPDEVLFNPQIHNAGCGRELVIFFLPQKHS